MLNHSSFLLVDGNNLFYRAYFANPELRAKDGTPTGAVFGFFKMLNNLMFVHQPQRMMICFDAKNKETPYVKQTLYNDYKQNRSSMPDDLRLQIPILYQALRLLEIPVAKMAGFEADDIIAHVSGCLTDIKHPHSIVSSDKDLTQLINPYCIMIDTMKKKYYEYQDVEDKFGAPPEKMKLYLSLIGDKSDNIPGVKGVGPKAAYKIIQQASTLDELKANLHSLEPSLKKKVESHMDDLEMSYRLVSFEDLSNIELDINDNSCLYYPSKDSEFKDLFESLDIKELGHNILLTMRFKLKLEAKR